MFTSLERGIGLRFTIDFLILLHKSCLLPRDLDYFELNQILMELFMDYNGMTVLKAVSKNVLVVICYLFDFFI